MAPATEIASLPTLAGSELENPSSPAAQIWRDTIATVSNQDGFQSAAYGRQVESLDTIELLIDWDSVEAHQNFMKSRAYGPFLKRMEGLVTGSPSLFHVNFKPHPPEARTAVPVSELVTFHFPSSLSESQQSEVVEGFHRFRETAEKEAEGCKGMSGGWVVEELEYNGEKGKAYFMIIGWDSVDAHMAYRNTQPFKDTIKGVSGMSRGIQMHHATLNEFEGTADTQPIGAEPTFTSFNAVANPSS